MMLVTVAQAKARLKLDVGDNDPNFTLMIEGASAAVLNYLKKPEGYAQDAIPPEVKNATLVLVGMMARDPDGTESKDWPQGYLPWAVTALIYPLRKPTVA